MTGEERRILIENNCMLKAILNIIVRNNTDANKQEDFIKNVLANMLSDNIQRQ